MTTHLTIKINDGETYTSLDQEELVIEEERLVDFDYALNILEEIIAGPAYQWDGPQTMRVIAFVVSRHMAAHDQGTLLGLSDFQAIREAVER